MQWLKDRFDFLTSHIVETLVLGIITSVIASYIFLRLQGQERTLLKQIWQACRNHPTTAVAALFVTLVGLLIIRAANKRARFNRLWEVSKPVRKVNPQDFRIQKYKEAYIARETDGLLDGLLKSGEDVLIVGKPKIGKTRSAYRVIKQIEGVWFIKLNPQTADPDRFHTIPSETNRRFVLFVDDLDRFIDKNVDDLVIRLKRRIKNLTIVATCRTGDELRLVKDQVLPLYREFKIVEVAEIAIEEGRKLALDAGLTWKPNEFDGTPGSVTLDLEDMKGRYLKAKEGKVVLRALKLLSEANLFFRQSLVKTVCSGVFELPAERLKKYAWDEVIGSLKELGFVTVANDTLYVYPSYLEVCVYDYEPRGELLKLQEVLARAGDSRSLFFLGNAYSYFKRDYLNARNCYREAVSIYPNYASAHNSLGYALTQLGEDQERNGKLPEADAFYQEAEREYKQAIAIKPTHAGARLNLGYLLETVGRPDEAEHQIKKAIEIKPDYAEAHTNLSYLLIARGRYEEAEQELKTAMAIRPDYPQAYSILGYLMMKQQKYVAADGAYRRALELKPDYGEVHQNLGHLLERLGRNEEAEKEFRVAISLMPNHVGIRISLGHLLIDLERYDEAEKLYRKTIEMWPNYASAHLQLGYLLVEQERYEEAEIELKRAMEIKPDYLEALTSFGYLLTEMKRYDEAQQVYERAIEINPQYSEACVSLGHLMEAQNRHDEAERQFKKAIALKPNHAEAHASLGYVLVRLVRYDEAEIEYRRALEIVPCDPKVHSNLGYLLAKVANYEEAESEYRLSIAQAPNRAEVHTNLGFLLTQMNRDAEAEKEYKIAISTKLDHVEAYTSLGHLLVEQGRHQEAERLYKEALKLNPGRSELHESLGYLLVSTERFEDAEREFKDALRINPASVRAHRHLGYLLAKTKRYEAAEQEYRKALEIDSSDKEADMCLAITLEKLGRDKEAEEQYKSVLRRHPGDGKVSQTYQYFLRERGRYADAEGVFMQVVQHMPDNEKDDWILIRYGRSLMDVGRPKEAQESLLAAIRFNPGNAEAHKNLGKSREMLGDADESQETKLYFYSEAHAAYAEAVRIKSNFVSGYRHFARLLAKLGRQAEAEDAYKKAKSIRNDPNVNRDYGVFLSKIGRIEESILELKSARDQFAKETNEEGVKQMEDLLTNLTER